MQKNVAGQKLAVFVFDYSTGAPKTGDAANLTAYVSKDHGAVTALTDTTATEADATNAKGVYLFDLTQAETNADFLSFTAKSATANVAIVPRFVQTIAPNTNLQSIDSNGRVDVIKVAGTTQTARDIGASVLLSNGTGTGQVKLSAGYVAPNWGDVGNPTTAVNLSFTTISTSQTVGSVSGSVGSVTGSVGSVSGSVGSVTGSVGSVTGAVGSVTTVSSGAISAASFAAGAINAAAIAADAIGASELAADAATEIAAAVWDKARASHTSAGSFGENVGKLPTAAAGATGGLLIAGGNASTTFASLTCTGALLVSGGTTLTSSTGDGVTISTTGTNGFGLVISGNGVGSGCYIAGGASGRGVQMVGGGSGGEGLAVYSQSASDACFFDAPGGGRAILISGTGGLAASALIVSGATTLTGVVTAANAANNIVGVSGGGGGGGDATLANQQSILAKLSTATVTVNSPVNAAAELEIVQGDDYLDAYGRALEFKVVGYTGYSVTGATVQLALMTLDEYDATGGTATTPISGTASMVGADLVIKFDVASAVTSALEVSPPADKYNYVYQVKIVKAGHTILDRLGAATVKKAVF